MATESSESKTTIDHEKFVNGSRIAAVIRRG